MKGPGKTPALRAPFGALRPGMHTERIAPSRTRSKQRTTFLRGREGISIELLERKPV